MLQYAYMNACRKMRIYPKGKDGKSTHLSLSLHMVLGDDPPTKPTPRIFAKFTLQLIDHYNHKNRTVKGTYIQNIITQKFV